MGTWGEGGTIYIYIYILLFFCYPPPWTYAYPLHADTYEYVADMWDIIPLKKEEYGIFGDFNKIYPKQYSIYLRGTMYTGYMRFRDEGFAGQGCQNLAGSFRGSFLRESIMFRYDMENIYVHRNLRIPMVMEICFHNPSTNHHGYSCALSRAMLGML